MARNIRVKVAIIMVILCLSTLSLVVRFWPSPSLDAQARDLANEALRGNASYVASHVPEVELKANGMTRAAAEALLRDVVLPNFRGVRILRARGSQEREDPSTGTWFYDVRLPNGRALRCVSVAEGTGQGSVTELGAWIKMGWKLGYYQAFPSADVDMRKPWCWGYERDKEKLARYGFRGFLIDVDTKHPRIYALEKAYEGWKRNGT